jgi:hypothetical protein
MCWEEDVRSELVVYTQRKCEGCGFDGLVSGDGRDNLIKEEQIKEGKRLNKLN